MANTTGITGANASGTRHHAALGLRLINVIAIIRTTTYAPIAVKNSLRYNLPADSFMVRHFSLLGLQPYRGSGLRRGDGLSSPARATPRRERGQAVAPTRYLPQGH